ncbi:MAG: ABC transporter ATP-binding protein [Candidatus Kapabacteria bacterium]|nr:ABC transporter ATP-binding protein [Candidatus Kapabacteria bacterium]
MIKAENITKSYSNKKGVETKVLTGLNLDVQISEFVAIMGASGAGKSTLLHILGSLDKPDSGTIDYYFNNEILSLTKLNAGKISNFRNQHVGFIFQFHHLLPEFTALENVMIPALIAGANQNTAKKDAVDLLEIVGVSHRKTHKPSELSGGEQQRIAIARALINHPSLILADEPTGNLDSTNAKAVLDLLLDLRKRFSLTTIIATHDPNIAATADRMLIMQDGKI